MIRRFIVTPLTIGLLAPVRLMLGLPIVTGMTTGNRVLMLARKAGLYSGPIHFKVIANVGHLGIGGKGI